MTPYRDVTDDEWQRVAALLPELKPRTELRGRPLANTRSVLNGVLWVMYSGATWSAMPRKYPSYQTCHRRFKAWHDSGVMKRVMLELYGESCGDLFATMEGRMRSHPVVHTGTAATHTPLNAPLNAPANAPLNAPLAAAAHKPQETAQADASTPFGFADIFKRAA